MMIAPVFVFAHTQSFLITTSICVINTNYVLTIDGVINLDRYLDLFWLLTPTVFVIRPSVVGIYYWLHLCCALLLVFYWVLLGPWSFLVCCLRNIFRLFFCVLCLNGLWFLFLGFVRLQLEFVLLGWLLRNFFIMFLLEVLQDTQDLR